MALFAWNLVTVFFICYFAQWQQLRFFVRCCNQPTDSESSTIVPRLSGRQSSVRNQVSCFLMPIPVVGEWRETRENPFPAIFPRQPFFCHFRPFSAIFNHFLPLPARLPRWSRRKTRGNPFPAIFHHFPPFPAIACLATVLSITRNARKPMTANFGQFLQC